MKTTTLLLFLILAVSVSGLPDLTIDKEAINMNVERGHIKEYNITLTNNGDMDIYNITFSHINNIEFPKIGFLGKGKSQTGKIKILTSNIYDATKISTISYFFIENQSSMPQIKSIKITAGGYVPNVIDAKVNDKIVFFNNDTINHTITDVSSTLDETVSPSTSYILNVANENNIIFFDRTNGNSGTINVEKNVSEEYIHSTALDKTLSLQISSKQSETDLVIMLIKDTFVIRNKDTKQLAIEVSNIGTETAKGIMVDMDWFNDTDYQQFDLEGGNSKYIFLDIEPNINKTEETNRTYNLDMNIYGVNTKTITKTVKVFVPYENMDETGIGNNTFTIVRPILAINETIEYCSGIAGKDDVRCEKIYLTKEKTIYKEQPSQFANVTNNELWQTIKIAKESPEKFEYLTKRIDDFNLKMTGSDDNSILNTLNAIKKADEDNHAETTQRLENLDKEIGRNTFWKNFWAVVKAIVIIVCLVLFGIYKYNERKHKIEEDGEF